MTHIDDQGHVVVDVTRADGSHEDIVLPDFHLASHDALPHWHPERAACATCTPELDIA